MKKNRQNSGGYGQYCPLALAAELLCKRWTILVISRLIGGCTTFNDIHQGVPRISPTLLSKRLEELEYVGIVKRKKIKNTNRFSYQLTEAGSGLENIITGMAVWGQYWARDMEMSDLDPGFLAWSMHTRLNTDLMPPGRTVLEFEFTGAPADCRRFWLVNNDGKVDMCLKNPGFETDLLIKADLRNFIESWRGLRDIKQEIRASRIKLFGPKALVKDFPEWLMLHVLASSERKLPGREKRVAERSNNSVLA